MHLNYPNDFQRDVLAYIPSVQFAKIEDTFPLPLRLIYVCMHNFILSAVEELIYYSRIQWHPSLFSLILNLHYSTVTRYNA